MGDYLLTSFDIIAIQEHWLFGFEQNYLQELCQRADKDCIVRCVDDSDPILQHQRPRGYGGVAIAFRKDLAKFISSIPDGSNSVLPVLIKCTPRPICLINCYLPCRGNHSEAEFDAELDCLDTIINKYSPSHDVVLCGDLNASLLEDRCSRDRKLLRWCTLRRLQMCDDYPTRPTHSHHRGPGASTIDYILATKKDLIYSPSVDDISAPNTSSHHPVSAMIAMTVNIAPPAIPRSPRQPIPNLDWSRCDPISFNSIVSDLLPSIDDNDLQCPEAWCETLTDVLLYAGRCSAPHQAKRPNKQSWDGDVSRAMAENKAALREWISANRPSSGPLYTNRRETKKSLRRALRQANAKRQVKIYEDISEAAESRNTKLFHKLIRHQRSSPAVPGTELIVDGNLLTSTDEVTRAWTKHFEHLATPQPDHTTTADHTSEVPYDHIQGDLLVQEWIATNSMGLQAPIDPEEVRKAILSLNNGKAADIFGLKAEHLKAAITPISVYLTPIFNSILNRGRSVPALKDAFTIPVHKKGKDRLSTDNYRGIMITPTLAKALDHVLLLRNDTRFHQSPLQFGFTKGLSPTMAALIVTETIADALDRRSTLYLIALDVKKAFDVVDHDILMHKMIDVTDPSSWSAIQDSLRTTTKVKLQGTFGEPFLVGQGVGQGKVNSTHNYKIYINNLLERLTESDQGISIGSHYAGSPTCADDVMLAADDPIELQTQLNITADYAKSNRYIIHPDKSKMVVYGVTNPANPQLNGRAITPSVYLTHLGIDRYAGTMTSDEFIESRVSLARRTAYSLMGSGFHGLNGISPSHSLTVYMTYVVPRLLYGLETLTLKEKQIRLLEQYHRKTLRHLQSLPDRTATCAVHLLGGIPPVEALLDIQILSLLCRISNQDDSVLQSIGISQLAMKNVNSRSWFVYAARRLSRYSIDALGVLQGQLRYQKMKTSITALWTNRLREDATTKSSLKYMDALNCDLAKPHSVWSATRNIAAERRKSIQKARLLTGSYLLQTNKAAFNQFKVDSTCPLCKSAPEDRQHLILECPALETVRTKRILKITSIIPQFDNLDPDHKLKIVLDSHFYPFMTCNRADLEDASRSLIFSLHCRRTSIINGS